MKELKYLNKFLFKYKYSLLLGVVFIVISNLFSIVPPILFGSSINEAIGSVAGGEPSPNLYKILLVNAGLIIASALAKGFFTFMMRQTIIVSSRKIEFDLRNEIYAHYQKLSVDFYKKNKIGDMMSRVTEDINHVRMYLGPAIMYTINLSVMLVIVFTQMFRTDAVLSFYTLIPLPFLSFLIYKISHQIHVKTTKKQELIAKLTAFVQERMSSIRVIKAFTLEKQTLEEYKELTEENKKKNLDLVQVEAFFFPLMLLLIGSSFLLILYIGGQRAINGQINVGEIAEFIIYLNMIVWPVTSIGWVSSLIQRAEASQKRINQFLKIEPRIVNQNSEPFVFNGKIEFINVSFTYQDTGIKALEGVSFVLEKGQSMGVIGKTGSGKSTLIDLLLRFYDVDEGEILIDGLPLKKLNLSDWRAQVGWVPQEAFLFSDTIENNISFGLNGSDLTAVKKSAINADLDGNIQQFKEKYQTVVGERGVTLSGGQRQRTSIARALIKKPKMYIFDDVLSALDTETEERVLRNLEAEIGKTSSIIISHRPSSTKNTDFNIILDEGKIVDIGTHEELIKTNEFYQNMHSQMGVM